ncbi:MAG: RluA family pseudouridine synthase [Clostridia bacterium]|nr:RluA family pseudouridine synthase [Clostridia bacterium]
MENDVVKLTACSPARCDVYIAENSENISRSFARKLFDEGRVLVNGKPVRASYKLKVGDGIEISLPAPKMIDARPQDIALDIVYEDESVLVINKPRGMVVHPAAGNEDNTLVNAVMHHCGDNLSAINGVLRPGIVHRIDKDTTGLLVVAKTNAAHLFLADQLSDHTLGRTYYALVHGNILQDNFTVDVPIARSEKDRKKMAVSSKNGRDAVTHAFVLERFGKYTFVKCNLETGRTHQIRVHMRHIGHPIFGDKTYGLKKEEFNTAGQLLHAGQISFIHPVSKEPVTFTAPLPADFEDILSKIGKKYN